MEFNFIDLCAGIGGFRIGMESIGGKCILSADIDKKVSEMYHDVHNISEDEEYISDLFDIPLDGDYNIDVICAGFPCQPFSSAGLKRGFEDPRGNVFFGIMNLVKAYEPKVVFLENVKPLINHDNGNTMNTIVSNLENEGYYVSYKILNNNNFGLPQNRERVFIVASKNKKFYFNKLGYNKTEPLKSILLDEERKYIDENDYSIKPKHLWEKNVKSGLRYVGHVKLNRKNLRKGFTDPLKTGGHSENSRIYHINGNIHTATASTKTYYVYDEKGVFLLTPEDMLVCQGFKRNFLDGVGSWNSKMKAIGNSVCPVITTEISKEMRNQNIL
jgi:DNA (cytosine-5)-methyltransferase 1